MASFLSNLIPQRLLAAMQAGAMPPTDLEGVEAVANPPTPRTATVEPMTPDLNPQMVQPLNYTPRAPPNYDNSEAAGALNQALLGLQPQGGSPNPGIYGLLPQRMQHGTLRNILGALGDAMLVQSGHAPAYGDRMARQQTGLAMAGVNPDDRDSVYEAATRMAGTGAEGGQAAGQNLINSYETAESRRTTAEGNAIYREGQLDVRRTNQFGRLAPAAMAELSLAQTPQEYEEILHRWQARVSRIAPGTDVTDALGVPERFGVLTSMAGMNNNQINQHYDRIRGQDLGTADRAAQRDTTERGQDISADSRIGSAIIGANRPSAAAFDEDYIERRRNGEDTTPEEDALFQRHININSGRGGRRGVPGGGTGGAPAAAASSIHGSGATPSPADIQWLRAHPEAAPQFDAQFGSAARAQAMVAVARQAVVRAQTAANRARIVASRDDATDAQRAAFRRAQIASQRAEDAANRAIAAASRIR